MVTYDNSSTVGPREAIGPEAITVNGTPSGNAGFVDRYHYGPFQRFKCDNGSMFTKAPGPSLPEGESDATREW